MKQAEAWLKRLCKLAVADLQVHFSRITLGGPVTWATLKDPLRNSDPFDPLPVTPEPLHDGLALDIKDRGLPLVLFVYSPPAGMRLKFPTIADARWGRLFRPAIADPTCTCGLTAPPTDDPAIKPAPELVHEQVYGDRLEAPLRILR